MTDEEMERKWVELKAQLEGSQKKEPLNIMSTLDGKRKEQERANIPKFYRDAHFGNFRTPIYSDQKTVKLMNEVIRKWYQNFEENYEQAKGLYLWSNAKGSGKTRMAISLLNEIMVEHGIYGYFTTSTQILTEIKRTWDRDDVSESELLDKLTKYHILVIDDFGTEIPKPWINTRFYHIINERYNNMKLTIYTSNHNLNRLQYDERIIDRIRETAYIVPFPEESVRAKISNTQIANLVGGQG